MTGYEDLLGSVTKLKDRVESVEVTEDNVKDTKKLRAAINKEIDKLKKSRTAVKSELLTAMDELDSKIKHVTALATEANGAIDSQIKKLEEDARAAKLDTLTELFEKYAGTYDLPKIVADGLVDMFFLLNRQVLNKSVTLSKGEATITNFLESIYQDVQTIGLMPHTDKTLAEYSQHLDLQKAIKTVAERVAREEAAKIKVEAAPVVHKEITPDTKPEVLERVTLTVAATDSAKAIGLLEAAGIAYAL